MPPFLSNSRRLGDNRGVEAFDVEEIGGRRYCVGQRQPDLPWHFILLMPWILLLTELTKKAWWTGVVIIAVGIVAIAIFEARRPRKEGLAVGVTIQAGVDDLASTRGLLSVVDGQLRFEGSGFRFALGASDFERVCRNQNLELCLRVSAHGDLPTQYIVVFGSPWTVRKATQLAEDAQNGGIPLFPPIRPSLYEVPSPVDLRRMALWSVAGSLVAAVLYFNLVRSDIREAVAVLGLSVLLLPVLPLLRQHADAKNKQMLDRRGGHV